MPVESEGIPSYILATENISLRGTYLCLSRLANESVCMEEKVKKALLGSCCPHVMREGGDNQCDICYCTFRQIDVTRHSAIFSFF